MKPSDVKSIRAALGAAAGLSAAGPGSLSQNAFGAMLGLSEGNARKTVDRWETEGPTGPAAAALTYIQQGLLEGAMKQIVPEHVFGNGIGDGGTDQDIVVRLWWPRFVATTMPAYVPMADDVEWAWIEPDEERLAVIMWIDDPAVPGAPASLTWVQRAATFAQIDTQDVMEG